MFGIWYVQYSDSVEDTCYLILDFWILCVQLLCKIHAGLFINWCVQLVLKKHDVMSCILMFEMWCAMYSLCWRYIMSCLVYYCLESGVYSLCWRYMMFFLEYWCSEFSLCTAYFEEACFLLYIDVRNMVCVQLVLKNHDVFFSKIGV